MKIYVLISIFIATVTGSSISGRIINGQNAVATDRFAVRIKSLTAPGAATAFLSTGVAISSYTIIGTAQALFGFRAYEIGYNDVNVTLQSSQTLLAFAVHPNFIPRTLENNIAVFRVVNPILTPISIATNSAPIPVWFGFGYGRNDPNDSSSVATILKSAVFSEVSLEDCTRHYNEIVIQETNFCGLSPNLLADGDQGGPLTDFNRQQVFGIISFWGINADLPAVFINFLNPTIREFIDANYY